MKYDDLLNVPFKAKGRDKNGMDCYGLVIEMAKRNGQELRDLIYSSHLINGEQLNDCIEKVNLKTITEEERRAGDIAEWEYKNYLHIGYFLDRETVINMTFSGVRIMPYFAIPNPKILRITDNGNN